MIDDLWMCDEVAWDIREESDTPVLQQRWLHIETGQVEWRDVPYRDVEDRKRQASN